MKEIKEAKANNRDVVLHCRAGINRAPTVMAVVTMAILKLSYDEAESFQHSDLSLS